MPKAPIFSSHDAWISADDLLGALPRRDDRLYVAPLVLNLILPAASRGRMDRR